MGRDVPELIEASGHPVGSCLFSAPKLRKNMYCLNKAKLTNRTDGMEEVFKE